MSRWAQREPEGMKATRTQRKKGETRSPLAGRCNVAISVIYLAMFRKEREKIDNKKHNKRTCRKIALSFHRNERGRAKRNLIFLKWFLNNEPARREKLFRSLSLGAIKISFLRFSSRDVNFHGNYFNKWDPKREFGMCDEVRFTQGWLIGFVSWRLQFCGIESLAISIKHWLRGQHVARYAIGAMPFNFLLEPFFSQHFQAESCRLCIVWSSTADGALEQLFSFFCFFISLN